MLNQICHQFITARRLGTASQAARSRLKASDYRIRIPDITSNKSTANLNYTRNNAKISPNSRFTHKIQLQLSRRKTANQQRSNDFFSLKQEEGYEQLFTGGEEPMGNVKLLLDGISDGAMAANCEHFSVSDKLSDQTNEVDGRGGKVVILREESEVSKNRRRIDGINNKLEMLLDDEEMTRRKNRMHKQLWKLLKVRRWEKWEEAVEVFKASHLPPDEVTYTHLLHGLLISKNHSSEEAYAVLNEMEGAMIHPRLIKLNKVLLDFHASMKQYDVEIADVMWRRTLRSVWLIAALVKGRRERYIGRLRLALTTAGVPSSSLPSIHSLKALWVEETDPLLPSKQRLELNLSDLLQRFRTSELQPKSATS